MKASAAGVSEFPTLEDAEKSGAITWNYGKFILSIVDFLIIALTLFFLMKSKSLILSLFILVGRFFFNRKKEETQLTKVCEECLEE